MPTVIIERPDHLRLEIDGSSKRAIRSFNLLSIASSIQGSQSKWVTVQVVALDFASRKKRTMNFGIGF